MRLFSGYLVVYCAQVLNWPFLQSPVSVAFSQHIPESLDFSLSLLATRSLAVVPPPHPAVIRVPISKIPNVSF